MTDIGVPVSQISGIALEGVPIISDPKYFYAVCGGAPGRILKIDKEDLSVVGLLILPTGENITSTNCTNTFVQYGNEAFISLASPNNRIVIVDLSTMTRTGHIDLSTDGATFIFQRNGAVKYGDYAYFLHGKHTGAATINSVFKIDLENKTEVGSLDVGTAGTSYSGILKIEPIGRYILYCQPTGGSPFLKRINVSDFSLDPITLSLSISGAIPTCGIISSDTQYVYIIGSIYTWKVPFSGVLKEIKRIDSVWSGQSYGYCVDQYARYGFIGSGTGTGIISLLDMVSENWLTYTDFNTGSSYGAGITIGDYSYWAEKVTTADIIKIRNADFSLQDVRNLGTGNDFICMFMVI